MLVDGFVGFTMFMIFVPCNVAVLQYCNVVTLVDGFVCFIMFMVFVPCNVVILKCCNVVMLVDGFVCFTMFVVSVPCLCHPVPVVGCWIYSWCIPQVSLFARVLVLLV